jgi:protein disulfide-isomerase A1
VSSITAANLEEFQKADKLVVIAYLPSATAPPAAEFSATAEKHRDDYLFGLTSDDEAIAAAGLSAPAIVVYRSYDEFATTYPYPIASVSVKDLDEWIGDLSIPILGEVNGDNYATYASSPKPLAYLFVDPSDEAHSEHIESIRPIAAQYRGKLNFVWIDAVKFGDHAKALNLPEPMWPGFVIQDMEKQLKYPFDQNIRLTSDRVAEHVALYHDGKLEPQLKSQPIPATQNETVYNLVGKQFEEVVFDDKKDVFVEFYASWYVFSLPYARSLLRCIWLAGVATASA